MEPLNITITDLSLDTVIDGDYEHGGRTQASLTKELAAIFAEEKAKVVKAVQGKAAESIAQAVKDGLR